MTRRLILVRHAKSDWDDPTQDDHDRPLNPRGVRSAKAIGRWLADQKFTPELVLCSTAHRTRETWELIAGAFSGEPELRFHKQLYLPSPDVIFETLARSKGPKTVLLLCHNPGTAIAATSFARNKPVRAEFDRYPSAATTVFDFPIDDWSNLEWRSGTVVDFVVPKDLIA